MKLFLLDTNVVSDLLRGVPALIAKYDQLSPESTFRICTITAFEILIKGRYQQLLTAASAAELKAARDRLRVDETALDNFPKLPITDDVCLRFENLLNNPKLKKPRRADLLIASIALAHDATLVTRNTKDFVNIPNLKLDNWAD